MALQLETLTKTFKRLAKGLLLTAKDVDGALVGGGGGGGRCVLLRAKDVDGALGVAGDRGSKAGTGPSAAIKVDLALGVGL